MTDRLEVFPTRPRSGTSLSIDPFVISLCTSKCQSIERSQIESRQQLVNDKKDQREYQFQITGSKGGSTVYYGRFRQPVSMTGMSPSLRTSDQHAPPASPLPPSPSLSRTDASPPQHLPLCVACCCSHRRLLVRHCLGLRIRSTVARIRGLRLSPLLFPSVGVRRHRRHKAPQPPA